MSKCLSRLVEVVKFDSVCNLFWWKTLDKVIQDLSNISSLHFFIRFLWSKNLRLQTGHVKQLWTWHVENSHDPLPTMFQQLPVQFNCSHQDLTHLSPDPTARCESLQFLRRHRGTGRWQCGTGCVSATYRARWARCTAYVAAKSRWAHHIVGEAGGTNLLVTFPKFNGWNPFEIDDAFQESGISYVWNGCVPFSEIFLEWPRQGRHRWSAVDPAEGGNLEDLDAMMSILDWAGWPTFSLLNFPSKWAICWWGLSTNK